MTETETETDTAQEPDTSPAETETETGPAEDSLVTQGDVAADYLEALLDIADLDGDIVIDVENDRASVAIVEAEPGELSTLVGDDGEVLNALQDLTRLAVARETGNRSRLMLDIAGFREAQRERLRQIGSDAVNEAKETQQAVRLAAMNSFERKVIHDVAADAGLSSESEGSEPNRYVVISVSE